MHIIVGRSSKLPPRVSREWLRRCLVALLEMAEEIVRANEAVMLIVEEVKRNAKHDRRISNLISSVDVFKLLFMLPQSRRHILGWLLKLGEGRFWCGERLESQVKTYKWGIQKKREASTDITYCWNLLCVVVTWSLCLKWIWWPIIFLWCLLYSSRQAGNDLVGDVVCFLAKLIADPVLT